MMGLGDCWNEQEHTNTLPKGEVYGMGEGDNACFFTCLLPPTLYPLLRTHTFPFPGVSDRESVTSAIGMKLQGGKYVKAAQSCRHRSAPQSPGSILAEVGTSGSLCIPVEVKDASGKVIRLHTKRLYYTNFNAHWGGMLQLFKKHISHQSNKLIGSSVVNNKKKVERILALYKPGQIEPSLEDAVYSGWQEPPAGTYTEEEVKFCNKAAKVMEENMHLCEAIGPGDGSQNSGWGKMETNKELQEIGCQLFERFNEGTGFAEVLASIVIDCPPASLLGRILHSTAFNDKTWSVVEQAGNHKIVAKG